MRTETRLRGRKNRDPNQKQILRAAVTYIGTDEGYTRELPNKTINFAQIKIDLVQ